MSIIRAIKHRLGLSVTPANNFVLDASADNGTMKLARESGQDIMTVDAAGEVAFPQNRKAIYAFRTSSLGILTTQNSVLIMNIPSGNAGKWKITAHTPQIFSTVANDRANVLMLNNVTQIQAAYSGTGVAGGVGGVAISLVAVTDVPSGGANIAINAFMLVAAGTLFAAPNTPVVLIAEPI